MPSASSCTIDRRRFVAYFAGLGLSSTLLPAVLWARLEDERQDQQAEGPLTVTEEMLAEAERIAGLEFTDEERALMVRGVNRNLQAYETLRTIPLPNDVPPALHFDPRPPGMQLDTDRGPARFTRPKVDRVPSDLNGVAFWPVTHLAELIRKRAVSAVDLTNMYLARLREHGPRLECVITLTEDRALEQARKADEEIAAGRYRGPLHGIPWGAKDLLAVRGYPTTWGAAPYKDQVIEEDATVVRKLDEAGAVLVAKLTLGALARGDVWYGGMTRNPWNLEQGSSGSSAGPAAATAAGLVGFSLGTETLGSIVSPSTRCGVSGLRPTYGRVSRYGAMALSWSMDKIGPICRTVEDCAVVFDAIRGPDGRDGMVVDTAFGFDVERDVRSLRVGYVKSAFEADREDAEWKTFDLATLEVLRSAGIDLVPIDLPDSKAGALRIILSAEAAAAFDELTRSNRDDLMVRQVANAWPNSFRTSRFIPAVEYIQANRARTLAIRAMQELMQEIDVYVAPSYGGDNLVLTNLTGHPCVVVPNGFRKKDGTPTSITFMGRLYGDAEALAVARAYQEGTDFHLKHPPLFG